MNISECSLLELKCQYEYHHVSIANLSQKLRLGWRIVLHNVKLHHRHIGILVIVMPMKVGSSWYYTIGYQKYEKDSSNAKVNRAPSLIEDSGDNYTLKAEACFDDLRSKL